MKTILTGLLRQIENIYDGHPWYGDSLLGKLDDVTPEAAFAVPAQGTHSVAQLVAHILVWRRVLAEYLKGNPAFRSELDATGDWPEQSELQARGWNKILSDLADNQREITGLLQTENDALLSRLYDGKNTFGHLIEGVIQHDVYHIGQIGLTLTLINKERLSQKV
jgi:uncharacterized damage-inducible protein DinB